MEAHEFDVPGNVRLIDVSRPAPGETPEQRIERLAQKGLISGIRMVREKRTGLLYATSASDAGTIYALNLTARSCSCDGFQRHGICSHLCLALVEAGLVGCQPPAREPVTCPECHGRRGERMSTGGSLSDWIWRTCSTCQGEGTI
jgi:hypothetical protein